MNKEEQPDGSENEEEKPSQEGSPNKVRDITEKRPIGGESEQFPRDPDIVQESLYINKARAEPVEPLYMNEDVKSPEIDTKQEPPYANDEAQPPEPTTEQDHPYANEEAKPPQNHPYVNEDVEPHDHLYVNEEVRHKPTIASSDYEPPYMNKEEATRGKTDKNDKDNKKEYIYMEDTPGEQQKASEEGVEYIYMENTPEHQQKTSHEGGKEADARVETDEEYIYMEGTPDQQPKTSDEVVYTWMDGDQEKGTPKYTKHEASSSKDTVKKKERKTDTAQNETSPAHEYSYIHLEDREPNTAPTPRWNIYHEYSSLYSPLSQHNSSRSQEAKDVVYDYASTGGPHKHSPLSQHNFSRRQEAKDVVYDYASTGGPHKHQDSVNSVNTSI